MKNKNMKNKKDKNILYTYPSITFNFECRMVNEKNHPVVFSVEGVDGSLPTHLQILALKEWIEKYDKLSELLFEVYGLKFVKIKTHE